MQSSHLQEARRQAQICNACRYCEGFCAVFPALEEFRRFEDGDLVHLANLCHDCRGCYYACQYTAPHEFDLNFPKALAQVRQDSWVHFAWPQSFATMFHRNGTMIAALMLLACISFFVLMVLFPSSGGEGFYSAISHEVMVAIFTPAFLVPLGCIAISIRRYWRATSTDSADLTQFTSALGSVVKMKNLAGGHGEGCNFEDQDRFSQSRRYAHQLMLYGFVLCFASTCSGAILHYVFDQPAPYPIWSFPKVFGISGGVAMSIGGFWMAALKWKAQRLVGDHRIWGGEMAFVLLLCLIAVSGLALYGLGQLSKGLLIGLLGLHLGSVITLFLLLPYSKMVHGFFRLAALVKNPGSNSDRSNARKLSA